MANEIRIKVVETQTKRTLFNGWVQKSDLGFFFRRNPDLASAENTVYTSSR